MTELYEKLFPNAVRACGGDIDAARDALADLLAGKSFEALEGKPDNFVRAAVRNVRTDRWREDERQHRHAREQAERAPRRVATPDEIVEQAELRTMVVRWMAALPQPLRQVVELRLAGYDLGQIAKRTGLPAAVVSNRVQRAADEMRTRARRERLGSWTAAILPLWWATRRSGRRALSPWARSGRRVCLAVAGLAAVAAVPFTLARTSEEAGAGRQGELAAAVDPRPLALRLRSSLEPDASTAPPLPNSDRVTIAASTAAAPPCAANDPGLLPPIDPHDARTSVTRLGVGPRAIVTIGERTFVADYDERALYAIDPAGNVLACARTELYLSQLATLGDRLIGLSPAGALVSFDSDDLRALRTVKLPGHDADHAWTVDGLTVRGSRVYAGSGVTGAVYEFDEHLDLVATTSLPTSRPFLIASSEERLHVAVNLAGEAVVFVLRRAPDGWSRDAVFRVSGFVSSLLALSDGTLLLAFEEDYAVRFAERSTGWSPCALYRYPAGIRVNRATVDEPRRVLWCTVQAPDAGLVQLSLE